MGAMKISVVTGRPVLNTWRNPVSTVGGGLLPKGRRVFTRCWNVGSSRKMLLAPCVLSTSLARS